MYVAVAAGLVDGLPTPEVIAVGNTRSDVAGKAAAEITRRFMPASHPDCPVEARSQIRIQLARQSQQGNLEAFYIAEAIAGDRDWFGKDTIVTIQNMSRKIKVNEREKTT